MSFRFTQSTRIEAVVFTVSIGSIKPGRKKHRVWNDNVHVPYGTFPDPSAETLDGVFT